MTLRISAVWNHSGVIYPVSLRISAVWNQIWCDISCDSKDLCYLEPQWCIYPVTLGISAVWNPSGVIYPVTLFGITVV